MTEREQLRVAVGILAHVVNANLATLAVLAESIPDKRLGADALKHFDEQSEAARRVAQMFPPESLPPEDRNLILH